jgi:hypothetical protein
MIPIPELQTWKFWPDAFSPGRQVLASAVGEIDITGCKTDM